MKSLKSFIIPLIIFMIMSCNQKEIIEYQPLQRNMLFIGGFSDSYWRSYKVFPETVSDLNNFIQKYSEIKYNLNDTMVKYNFSYVSIKEDKFPYGYMILYGKVSEKSILLSDRTSFLKNNNILPWQEKIFSNDKILLYEENEYKSISEYSSLSLDKALTQYWKNKGGYSLTLEVEDTTKLSLNGLKYAYQINDTLTLEGEFLDKKLNDLNKRYLFNKSLKGFKFDSDFYLEKTIIVN